MAAPELVIADAPFKTYPGGIIALRASDWLGAARGTLSTESDARSITGTVVRDSQQTASTIRTTDPDTIFAAMDDTLVIPLADLPIEEGMYYLPLLSYLIEGDWDTTNEDTCIGGTQELFGYACDFRIGGLNVDGFNDTGTIDHCMYRGIDSYRLVGFQGAIVAADSADTMVFKAYSQDGTTIEWLLDQIVLVPMLYSGSVGEWQDEDFKIFGGTQGANESVYALRPEDVGPGDYPEGWVDGADGGDANGKFSWQPYQLHEPIAWGLYATECGGGDFQKDDNEYMVRVVADLNDDGDWSDFFYLTNSLAPTEHDPRSHCYGAHGPFYTPAQTWLVEDFARDTGGNHDFQDPSTTPTPDFEDHEWGRSPEGFYWRTLGIQGPVYEPDAGHNHGGAAYCNSSGQGVLAHRTGDVGSGGVGVVLQRMFTADTGAGIAADNIRIRGSFFTEDTEAGVMPDSTPFTHQPLTIGTGNYIWTSSASWRNTYKIGFEMRTGQWVFGDGWESVNANFEDPISFPPTYGPIDVSSWWDHGVEVGFRIEVHRHWVRAKLWELSAGEPGTWDYEEFRTMSPSAPIGHTPYDYGDDLNASIETYFPQTVCLRQGGINHRFAGSYAVYFTSLEVTYDPEGDNESAHALIERPEGNEIGRIEMPAGAQHLVYWGKQPWSKWSDDNFGNYIDFSAKVWNDPGAAELQRSEALFYWLRSVHATGGIVSMNWSSAQPVDITRVHA